MPFDPNTTPFEVFPPCSPPCAHNDFVWTVKRYLKTAMDTTLPTAERHAAAEIANTIIVRNSEGNSPYPHDWSHLPVSHRMSLKKMIKEIEQAKEHAGQQGLTAAPVTPVESPDEPERKKSTRKRAR